jgi:hypothetical protein
MTAEDKALVTRLVICYQNMLMHRKSLFKGYLGTYNTRCRRTPNLANLHLRYGGAQPNPHTDKLRVAFYPLGGTNYMQTRLKVICSCLPSLEIYKIYSQCLLIYTSSCSN